MVPGGRKEGQTLPKLYPSDYMYIPSTLLEGKKSPPITHSDQTADFFSSKNQLRNVIRVSNSSDPDQDQYFVQTVCYGYQQKTLAGS